MFPADGVCQVTVKRCGKCQTAEGARSRRGRQPVTPATVSPGHVTARLLRRVLLPSLSHGGVGESRRWSKHRQRRCSSLISRGTLHAEPSPPSSEKSQTSRRLLRSQRWRTAASMCRLCLKRSGTSWQSWIWSCPKVSPAGVNGRSCGGDGWQPGSVGFERVYVNWLADSQLCCSGSGHVCTKIQTTDIFQPYPLHRRCCIHIFRGFI